MGIALKKDSIFKEFFFNYLSFLRYGRFWVWAILHTRVHIHQNRPHTKSTISQKLKVAQLQIMNLKIIARAMRIFPANLATF